MLLLILAALLVSFVCGFVLAVCLARESNDDLEQKIARLRHELNATKDRLVKANRMLHVDFSEFWSRN